jgi:hypothetical protein
MFERMYFQKLVDRIEKRDPSPGLQLTQLQFPLLAVSANCGLGVNVFSHPQGGII